MKKHLLLIGALLMCLPTILSAQAKYIEAGIKLYESGSYKKAIEEMDKGLSSDGLKDKVLARGHYYRGHCKITWLNKLKSWENLPQEMDATVADYGLTAASDLQKAKKHDVALKYKKEINTDLKRANRILLEMAKIALLEGNKTHLEPDVRKAWYERVIPFTDASIALDKFNYIPYKIKAEALLALEDSVAALKNFHLADDCFFRSAPKTGDLSIAYTYMSIAELERDLNHNMKEARAALEEGKERLEGENQKIQVLGNRRPEEKAKFAVKYKEIKKDLARLEAAFRESE